MATRRQLSDGSVYQKTVLSDGLRIVTEQIPAVRSISLGVWVNVGARNESADENGVTHMIEHMLFKGTKKRTALQLAAEIENIGGMLNAFTSREQTCYLARVMYEHLSKAVDVLADLSQNATLTPTNLAKEKKVICEEIKESLENPSDHVYDIFARAYWGSHPLGQPILGSIDTVSNMPRNRLINYIERNYKSKSVVIAASGAVKHSQLVRLVRQKFKFAKGEAEIGRPAKRDDNSVIEIESNGLNQTHVCIGLPGVKYADSERTAALALASYLGGGMSSVLFQKIREQRGLAYSVYTYHDTYRDAGIFGAYLATDPNGAGQSLAIIAKELIKLKKKRLSKKELDQVKAQLKGNLTLGMESTSSRMNRLARQELLLQGYRSVDETIKEIDSLTPSKMLHISNKMFDLSQVAIAVKGPADKEVLENALQG
jgi:predicted Zn-dependent peptidase